jgi:hypothetical protein
MPVTDLDEGAGLGYRDVLGVRRLDQTPTGLALPAFAPLSLANAGRFPLTRDVLISYAPQFPGLVPR